MIKKNSNFEISITVRHGVFLFKIWKSEFLDIIRLKFVFFINLTILPSCIGCWIGNEVTERRYLFINSKPSSEIPLLDIHLSGTQSVPTPWYSSSDSLVYNRTHWNTSLLLGIRPLTLVSVPLHIGKHPCSTVIHIYIYVHGIHFYSFNRL